jgi:hypothetical protein
MSPRTQGLQVLDVFRKCPEGLTTEEVCGQLNGQHQSISSRVTELRKAGCLIELPMRRHTNAGGSQPVYVVVDEVPDSKYESFLKKRRSQKDDGLKEWADAVLDAARAYAFHGRKAEAKLLEEAKKYPKRLTVRSVRPKEV